MPRSAASGRARSAATSTSTAGRKRSPPGFSRSTSEADKIITAYRDHAHALLLGSHPNEVMAELYGKGTGLVKGKGGSMHLFDVENGLLGGYGIVGGHIPLGVGMAYALRYQETDGIVQLYLGDGAIHNGAFHEAANLAGLWGRDGMNPTLFILENNNYGMGTSVERATAMTDLSAKFDSYGIEHEDVDGMDLFAVLEVRRASHEAGARDRRALRHRGDDLPHRPARRGRLPGAVPHQGGDRGVAQARPDRSGRSAAAGGRRARSDSWTRSRRRPRRSSTRR